jgi:hypothetical protein
MNFRFLLISFAPLSITLFAQNNEWQDTEVNHADREFITALLSNNTKEIHNI